MTAKTTVTLEFMTRFDDERWERQMFRKMCVHTGVAETSQRNIITHFGCAVLQSNEPRLWFKIHKNQMLFCANSMRRDWPFEMCTVVDKAHKIQKRTKFEWREWRSTSLEHWPKRELNRKQNRNRNDDVDHLSCKHCGFLGRWRKETHTNRCDAIERQR